MRSDKMEFILIYKISQNGFGTKKSPCVIPLFSKFIKRDHNLIKEISVQHFEHIVQKIII